MTARAGAPSLADLPYRATAHALGLSGRVRTRVGTRSMWPLIWPGARVWVERCDPAALRPGDLVVYQRPGGLPCLHRVVGWDGAHLRTAGDGNARPDLPLHPSHVLGAVRGVVIGRWHFEGAPPWLAHLTHRGVLFALPALRGARSILRRVRGRPA